MIQKDIAKLFGMENRPSDISRALKTKSSPTYIAIRIIQEAEKLLSENDFKTLCENIKKLDG